MNKILIIYLFLDLQLGQDGVNGTDQTSPIGCCDWTGHLQPTDSDYTGMLNITSFRFLRHF